MTERGRQLPADAVLLTEIEATGYVWKLVSGWSELADTWALRWGPGILGGLSAVGGILINQHFRTRLRLGTYGHFSSLLPIVALPGMFTAFFHREFVSTRMLLRNKSSCFICQEVKAAAFQCGFGVLYPTILAPTSAFMFANRYNTYRLPSIQTQPRELFQFVQKISRPLGGTLAILIMFNFVGSSVITYFEMKNVIAVMKKIEDIEKKIDVDFM